MTENSHQLPSEPPPAYGAVEGGSFPQPGQLAPPPITEPPPRYEAPKDGPYAPQPPPQQFQPQPYPQQVYPTAPQPPGTTVIRITNPRFGANPTLIKCPHCQSDCLTTVSYTSGCLTWVTSAFLCFIGAWVFGGCLIPFCLPGLMDVEHKCSNCGRHVGTYNRV
ncbi:hypothetical protein CAPTEDRAFT_182700 [Capitella teleta]|uniref:LITAF domain-containing protein n=1 Tax=Capitella teleta TaxID=283909 RepID=R7VDD6_CAPTE|nr:hypothetical protein CAPTEDRAFT_182700 [Capitella teleta]|eukprot:ELU16582.1 hypothetical protein CAPTEDRAFT_182700 [Capitella teleta]